MLYKPTMFLLKKKTFKSCVVHSDLFTSLYSGRNSLQWRCGWIVVVSLTFGCCFNGLWFGEASDLPEFREQKCFCFMSPSAGQKVDYDSTSRRFKGNPVTVCFWILKYAGWQTRLQYFYEDWMLMHYMLFLQVPGLGWRDIFKASRAPFSILSVLLLVHNPQVLWSASSTLCVIISNFTMNGNRGTDLPSDQCV